MLLGQGFPGRGAEPRAGVARSKDEGRPRRHQLKLVRGCGR